MAKVTDSPMTTKGLSGTEYAFNIYPMDQSFKAVGGVYVITRRYKKRDGGHKHDFIYIGETGDLSTRFDNHHKADCFAEHNATCICVLVNNDEDERLAIEDDLVKKHAPPCNG